jgi:hypothetical protein
MTNIYLQETGRWKREKPRKNTKAHSPNTLPRRSSRQVRPPNIYGE